MGLFNKKQDEIDFENIVSVVILEQTQLYKGRSKLGITFGSDLGDGSVIAMDDSVPAGSEITFSITYSSGKKKIVKLMSGTDECNELLQIALDPVQPESCKEKPKEYESVSLQKNQLPNGDYLIGTDIPAGFYDFTWVFGAGQIMKFVNDHDTTLGATTYIQNVGSQYDYQYRQCLNVKCDYGELLRLSGNMIVQISKSKKVELDL